MRLMSFRPWQDTRRLTEFRLLRVLPADLLLPPHEGHEGSAVAFVILEEGDLIGEIPIFIQASPDIVDESLRKGTPTICALYQPGAIIDGGPALIAWIECECGEMVGVTFRSQHGLAMTRPKVLH